VCDSRMSTAFSGNTQNVGAWNVEMIDEKEKHHNELRALEERKKILDARINAQAAQDEDAMYERDEVEKEIEDLKAYMKKYGLEGGRRKSHRRKSHRRKSRRSKSCAKKSRRSKSRRSKSRRSKH